MSIIVVEKRGEEEEEEEEEGARGKTRGDPSGWTALFESSENKGASYFYLANGGAGSPLQ